MPSRIALLGCALVVLAPIFCLSQGAKNNKRWTIDCGYDWPKSEVPWIITDEERAAFYRLTNDTQRGQFIEQFWGHRDPTPKTIENEFRDTYYQRILYANQHFGFGNEPGWLTPRGRIYVLYGAPDSIEQQTGNPESPATVTLRKKCADAKPFASPYEIWRYGNLAGVNHPVAISFADVCGTGEPLPIVGTADTGWLSRPPIPKYKLECNGKYDPNKFPRGMTQIICLDDPPHAQFKDLQEIVNQRIDFHMLPFQVGYGFEPVTSRTVAWSVDLTFSPDTLKWTAERGDKKAHVQLYGRISTLTGHIARSFERDVTFNSARCGQSTY